MPSTSKMKPAMAPPIQKTPVHQPMDGVFDKRGEDERGNHRGEKRGDVPGDTHASGPTERSTRVGARIICFMSNQRQRPRPAPFYFVVCNNRPSMEAAFPG